MASTSSQDHTTAQEAQEVVEAILPNDDERHAVLSQLLRSSDAANRVAPNAWAVTLFSNMIRLNVGQVETFVAGESGSFFLNCSASPETAPFNTGATEPAKYASVPQPQCRYWGKHADLLQLPDPVQRAHLKFVEMAARSPSGKPRAGTSFAKKHCAGLITYAESVVRPTQRTNR